MVYMVAQPRTELLVRGKEIRAPFLTVKLIYGSGRYATQGVIVASAQAFAGDHAEQLLAYMVLSFSIAPTIWAAFALGPQVPRLQSDRKPKGILPQFYRWALRLLDDRSFTMWAVAFLLIRILIGGRADLILLGILLVLFGLTSAMAWLLDLGPQVPSLRAQEVTRISPNA